MRRALALALTCGLAAASMHAAAAAQEENRAVVVVELPSGETRTACVVFKQPSITGLDLLVAAEMDPETYAMGPGAAVCKLCGEGCKATRNECLSCDGGKYWQYYRADGGEEYHYSNAGAGSSEVTDGDVDGWRFDSDHGEPVLVAVETVCSDPARTFRYEPQPASTTTSPASTTTAAVAPTTTAYPPATTAPTTAPSSAAAVTTLAPPSPSPPDSTTSTVAATGDADRGDGDDVAAPSRPGAPASETRGSGGAGVVALGALLVGIAAATVRARRRSRPTTV